MAIHLQGTGMMDCNTNNEYKLLNIQKLTVTLIKFGFKLFFSSKCQASPQQLSEGKLDQHGRNQGIFQRKRYAITDVLTLELYNRLRDPLRRESICSMLVTINQRLLCCVLTGNSGNCLRDLIGTQI
ncbi:hypothetical protein M9H77_35525 [Catharanthus roseus]|uniref:Uncharacterized protein n=1 Tax=Catharanthus roseus TaxID=4058 RepID=A0ACB9ZPJ4_CATRO|nr:hypothetical protein M9H77_35525 [Catharanthus roseus]